MIVKALKGIEDALSGGAKEAIGQLPTMGMQAAVGGRLQGAAQRGMMRQAYPGTGALDHLRGSTPDSGKMAVAGVQARSAERVAKIQAGAQIKSAELNSMASRHTMDATAKELGARSKSHQAKAVRDSVETQIARSVGKVRAEEAKLAKEYAETGLRAQEFGNVMQTIATLEAKGHLSLGAVKQMLMKFPNVSIDNAVDFYRAVLDIRDDLNDFNERAKEGASKTQFQQRD